MTDQTGKRVSSTRFAGKVQVVSFLFPYCTTDCPLLARDLAMLQQRLADTGLAGKAVIVTFNVDPGGATPRQLAQYIGQYGGHADPADAAVPWYFLTGTPATTRKLLGDGFHVAYRKVHGSETGTPRPNPLAKRADPGYDVQHSDLTYIIDGSGVFRTVYTGTSTITVDKLTTAVRNASR